jgi:hypothetical protein
MIVCPDIMSRKFTKSLSTPGFRACKNAGAIKTYRFIPVLSQCKERGGTRMVTIAGLVYRQADGRHGVKRRGFFPHTKCF